ncbi:MAG: MFS transporter [Bacteroidia bacterium]
MSHSPLIIPISASRMLERFAYYGMRSIVVLYMTQKLGMTNEQTYSVYGLLTAAVGLMSVFGGLLGDLAIGTRLSAIIGGFVEAAGILLLAIPGIIPVYLGLFLIAIGSGLYAPNLTSMISFVYKEREDKLDSAMTILYVCINAGAFFAPLAIGYIGERVSYQLGFVIAGAALMGAQLFLLLSPGLASGMPKGSNINLPDNAPRKKAIPPALVIVAVFFTMVLFWQLYEYVDSPIYDRLIDADSAFPYFSGMLQIFTTAPIIPFGIIMAILFTFLRSSSFIKIFIGCILFIISCLLLALSRSLPMASSWMFVVFAGTTIQGVSELFIAPTALSVIGKYTSDRFRATIFGAYMAASSLIGFALSAVFHIGYDAPSWVIVPVTVGIMAIIAGIFLTFYLLSKKE